jgi:hypothetical protein
MQRCRCRCAEIQRYRGGIEVQRCRCSRGEEEQR